VPHPKKFYDLGVVPLSNTPADFAKAISSSAICINDAVARALIDKGGGIAA
jgi:hypothetical protein